MSSALYVLDSTNFNWYIPNISGQIPKATRAWHRANLIGKYMVVTFGKYTFIIINHFDIGIIFNQSMINLIGQGYTRGTESNVLLLDISNSEEYMWVVTFDPKSVVSSSAPSSSSSIIIIIITIMIILFFSTIF